MQKTIGKYLKINANTFNSFIDIIYENSFYENFDEYLSNKFSYNYVLISDNFYFGSYGGVVTRPKLENLLKFEKTTFYFSNLSHLSDFYFSIWFKKEKISQTNWMIGSKNNKIILPKDLASNLTIKQKFSFTKIGYNHYFKI